MVVFVSIKNQTEVARLLELLREHDIILNSDIMVPKFGVYTAHLKRQ